MAATSEGHEAAMQRIKDFCFESSGFTDTFTEWSKENAHRIDLSMKATEHHLDYTAMHQEFVEVFEKRLEDRVMEEGISVEDFFLWLKHDLEEDPVSNNSFVVDLLLAMSDFGIFMQMMRRAAKDAAEAAAAAGASEGKGGEASDEPPSATEAASESKK